MDMYIFLHSKSCMFNYIIVVILLSDFPFSGHVFLSLSFFFLLTLLLLLFIGG